MYHDNLDDLRTSYDRNAPEREQYTIHPWKVEERQAFLALLQQQGKHSLLEIGAGTGRDSKFFQDNGLEVVCTDLSPEMVALCRAKGLTAHTMDFLNLDFPAQSFDAVYALNCLLHVPKNTWDRVLTAVRELLKPGGVFYLGVYGGMDFEGVWPDDAYTPKRFFAFHTDEQIQQRAGQHFDLRSFKTIPREDDSGLHFQALILQRRGE